MAKPKYKYTAICATLPKFPGDDPARAEVISRVKAEIIDKENLPDPIALMSKVHEFMDECDKRMQAVVIMEKRAAAGRPWASEFARVWAELRALQGRVDGWSSSLGVLIEAYHGLMIDQFEVEGINGLTLANGAAIHSHPEPRIKINDKEKLRLWCIADGLEREMHINFQKLQSLVKKRLLAGDPEPDGVEAFSWTKVSLGKGDEPED